MACWVAPSVAADYWNIPLEQVMDRISSGEIPSRMENGFTVVDLSPEMPAPLSRKEIEALTKGLDEAIIEAESVADEAPENPQPTTPHRTEAILSELEQAALRDKGDWRTARRIAGAKRRPPGRRR